MSQYPSAPTFLQGGNSDSVRLSRTRQVPQTGSSVPLDAPGLAVQTPDYSGAAMFDRLQQALGLTGETAAQTVNVYAERLQQARIRAERAQADLDQVERGRASLHARTMLPELERQIAEGKLAPAAGQTAAEFAEEYTRLESEGTSDVYKEAFASVLQPAVAKYATDKIEIDTKTARAELVRAVGESAIQADTSDSLRAAVASAKRIDPTLTDSEALAATALKSMESAAIAGDAGRLRIAQEVLGTNFSTEQLKLQAVLQRTLESDRRDVEQTFRNDIAELWNNGVPPEVIRQSVRRYSSIVAPDLVDQQLREIDAREAASNREAFARAKKDWQESIVHTAVQDSLSGLETGDFDTSFNISQGIEVEAPDGTTFKVTGKELLDKARQEQWATFDRTIQDPQQNFAAKVRWLSRNPTARDPRIEQAFAGISQRITAEASDENVPPVSIEAFNLYRQMHALSPGVLASHMPAEDLEFLRATDFLATRIKDMTPASAMVSVARAGQRGQSLFHVLDIEISRNDLDNYVTAIPDNNKAINSGFVRGEIRARAAAYMIAFGVDKETALNDAAAKFDEDWDVVNGFWIQTRGREVFKKIDDLQQGGIGAGTLSDIIVDGALSSMTDKLSYTAEDLTLAPFDDGWRIIDTTQNGMPIVGSPVISDADLLLFQDAYKNDIDYEEAVQRHESQITRRVQRGTLGTGTMLMRTLFEWGGYIAPNVPPDKNKPMTNFNLPALSPSQLTEQSTRTPKRLPTDAKPWMKPILDAAKRRRERDRTPKSGGNINARVPRDYILNSPPPRTIAEEMRRGSEEGVLSRDPIEQ